MNKLLDEVMEEVRAGIWRLTDDSVWRSRSLARARKAMIASHRFVETTPRGGRHKRMAILFKATLRKR